MRNLERMRSRRRDSDVMMPDVMLHFEHQLSC